MKKDFCPICGIYKLEITEYFDERGLVESHAKCADCELERMFVYGDTHVKIRDLKWMYTHSQAILGKVMEKEIDIVYKIYNAIFIEREKPDKELYEQFLVIVQSRQEKKKVQEGYAVFDDELDGVFGTPPW